MVLQKFCNFAAYSVMNERPKVLKNREFTKFKIMNKIIIINTNDWKTQARMTLAAKVDLTPENNLLLTPEEFGRRGQFYFGLSAFEGFEFTDAFTG